MRQRSDYPTFSDQEMARRHRAIQTLMDQEGVDALLVYGTGRYSSDVYWLTDWPCGREAYVLFQNGKEPVVLMQLFNHFPMARVMSVVKDVRWAGANTANSVLDLVQERALVSKKIGLVGSLPYQHYNRLREKFPKASFLDLGGKLRMMRTVKSADTEMNNAGTLFRAVVRRAAHVRWQRRELRIAKTLATHNRYARLARLYARSTASSAASSISKR